MAITFQVGFQINSEGFKKAFGDLSSTLQKDIQNALNISTGSSGLSKELSSAVTQANMLEKALRRATTDKGLSFSSLTGELTKMGTSVETVLSSLAGAGPTFSDSFNAASQAIASADRGLISLNGRLSEMKRVLTQSMKFTFAAQLQQSIANAFSEAIQWTEELNEALTEISIVANKTGAALDRVYTTTIEKSRELQVSAQDYAEASLIYYQQGLNDSEVERRTDITIKSAEAAGQSVETMASQLTAIWNTYGMIGEEQERAASVGARLAADTAVDFRDIAEGMQISASAAAQMGVSYNSLAAIIATVGDTTQQSASVIGNAYKTIFSRFYNLVSSPDGAVELGRISEQLKELGINIMDTSGELIPLDQIIQSIGNSWDKYSQKQQIAIAEVVGGTRQYTQFLALMQNFDKYMGLLNSANNEDGTALAEQYENSLNDIETAATNAGEAWSIAFSKVVDQDVLKSFYNIVEDLGTAFGTILENAGGLQGILLYLSGFLFKSLISQTRTWGAQLTSLIKNLTPEMQRKQIQKSIGDMVSINGQNPNSGNERQGKLTAQTKLYNQYNQNIKSIKGNTADKDLTYAQRSQIASETASYKAAQQKLEIYKKTATKMVEINTLLEHGTAEQKVWAESEKQRLLTMQQSGNELTDQINDMARYASQQQLLIENQLKNLRSSQVNNLTGDDINILSQTQTGSKSLIKDSDKQKLSSSGLQDLVTEYNSARNALNKAVKNQSDDLDEVQARFDSINDRIKQILQNGEFVTEEYRQQIEQLEKQEAVWGSLSKLFEIDFSNTSGQEDEIIDQYNNFLNALQNAGEDVELFRFSEGDDISLMGQQLQNIFQQMRSEGNFRIFSEDQLDQLAQAGGDMSQLVELMRQFNQERQSGGEDSMGRNWGMAAEGIAQAAGAMVSLYSATQSAFIALNQAEDSGDKIGVVLQTVAMGIPSIIGLVGGLSVAIKGLGLEAQLAGKAIMGIPIIGWIAAAITLVITLVSWFASLKQQAIDDAKEAAEAAAEVEQASRDLTNTIRDNTKAVKENEEAWHNARLAGEDASSQYETLLTSLETLTESLNLTSDAQAELNELMTAGLATGDLSNYYEKVREEQEKAFNQNLSDSHANQLAQLSAVKIDSSFDGDGAIDLSEDLYDSTTGLYEYSEGVQEIIDKYDSLKDYKIDLDFDDPSKFRQQYEELIEIKREFESTFDSEELKNNDAYKDITNSIEELSDAYDQVKASAEAAIETINSMYTDDAERLGEYIGDLRFSEGIDELDKIASAIQAAGQQAGLSQQEIDNLMRSVTSSNAELNAFVNFADKVAQTRAQMSTYQSWTDDSGQQQNGFTFSSDADYKNTISQLENLQNQINNVNTSGIGWWFNGLSAVEEKYKDILGLTQESGESNEDFAKRINSEAQNVSKILETARDEYEAFQEYSRNFEKEIDSLSEKEREIFVNIEVEGMDKIEEIGEAIEAYRKAEIEIAVKPDYQATINEANTLQENLSGAISSAQSNEGKVEMDVVQELLALGPEYKRYIIEMADGFYLTTEAIDAYNNSILEEREATAGLLNDTVDAHMAFGELSKQAAVLAAVLNQDTEDSSFIAQQAEGLQELTRLFNNGKIDADAFFKGFQDSEIQSVQVGFDEYIKRISDNMGNLSTADLEAVNSLLIQATQVLTEYLNKSNDAFQAGEIGWAEYTNQITNALTSTKEINDGTIESLKQQLFEAAKEAGVLSENFEDVSEVDFEELSNLEYLEDAPDEVKNLAKQLNKATKAGEELSEAISAEPLTDALAQMGEDLNDEIADIFDEDYGLKLDINTDEALAKLQTLGSKIHDSMAGLLSEYPELEAQLASFTTEAANSIAVMQGLTNEQATLVATAAQEIITNGQITDTTLANMQSSGLSTQQAYSAAVAAASQTSAIAAQDAASAITGGMAAAAESANTFQLQISADRVDWQEGKMQIPGLLGDALRAAGFSGEMTVPLPVISMTASGNFQDLLSGLGITGGGGTGGGTSPISIDPIGGGDSAGGYTPVTTTIPTTPGGYTPEKQETEKGDYTDLLDDTGGKTNNGNSGGSEFEPEELLDEEDIEKFVERYENITKAIERQTDALEDISGLMDDAYGARRLSLMDAYNKKIQQMAKNQKEYIKEAQKYYKEDKEALLNSDPAIKALARFDPGNYGGISNPETIRRYLEDQAKLAWETYNNEIIKYNNAGDASDAAKARLDKAKESYDQTIATLTHQNELLDQLLDTEETLQEAINDQVENIRNWMANKVEQATYKMELRIEINDFEIELMDQIKDAFGDIGLVGGQSLDLIHSQLGLINQDVDETISSVDRLYEIANNIASPENQEYFMDLFGSTEEGILAWKQYIGTGEIPQEVMDALNDSRDSLLDYYGQVLDYLDELWEGYITSINFYMDQVDNLIGRLESRADIADTFLDIIEKSGLDHKWGADKNSSQYKLMSTNMDNIASQAKALQTQFTIASEKAAEMKAELDDILQGRDPSQLSEEEAFIYNRVNEQYQELQEQANDLESQMYEAIATALDKAQEYAEAWGERIAHDWSEKLGGVFDDLSDAMDMYNQKQELTDFYMDDYDKIYELNKLQREIEDALEDTSDPERLEGYNSLLDQIEQKKQDGVKMTQTELEILQQQFQLEKDRDAYEDAQNAKNTMRLARDASGNWNYVYSNDSSANEEDSAQKIEDTLANIHRLHREAADEMGELWLQTYTELYEYLQNVDWAMYEQDTKYKEMVDQKRQWYMEALDNYAKYFEYHNEAIGRNQSETTLGIIMNFDDLGDKNEWYKGEMDNLVEDLKDNYDDWMGKADQARQEISDDYTSLEEMVNDKTNDIIQENEDTAEAVEQMARDTRDWLDKSAGYTQSWAREVISYYDNVISKIKEYLALIQQSNKDALEADTGFNAQRDYTATIHNYAQDFINAGGTAEELMKDPTYLQMGKELANKIADSELNQSGHVVEDMAAMTDDGLGYLKEIAQNTKPDPDADRWDEFDESWQAAERGDAGSKLDPVYGTSVPKPTASGGLVKTPQVRSLAEEGPELVLNADDTRNILSAVSQMREVVKLKMQNINGVLGRQTDNVTQKSVVNKDVQQIEQAVHIDATFPNVSVAAEIEEAFSNLVNQAVQYASAKKK